jgi:DNA-binding GntR family transcriptional regulator
MPRKLNSNQKGESKFLKQTLALRLREEIMQGRLSPGQRIVEVFWARRFGVAQISVREAINLLIAEGFVTKSSGRSARVTNYTETDIAQIYELRGALEGLAARLASQRRVDLDPLMAALGAMRQAIRRKDVRFLLEADLRFHLKLCELSGNRILQTQAHALLVPFFAFVSIRAGQMPQSAVAWEADLDRHRRMVDLIAEGEPNAAEFCARAALQQFEQRARCIWTGSSASKIIAC